MHWTRWLPNVGDLIVLQYHKGRRVGIFVRKELKKINKFHSQIGIVWHIEWIPVENGKLPSVTLSELSIMHYLKSGKAQIFKIRREDEL